MTDLTIPEFLRLDTPEKIAAWRQGRENWKPAAAHVFVDRVNARDAETEAFYQAEAERKRLEEKNHFALLDAKKKAEREYDKGGRWDAGRNMWISAEQDFAEGAARIGMSVDELLEHTRACAALDPGKTDCIANQARKMLAALDRAKLVEEGDKAARRAKAAASRALKRRERELRSRPRTKPVPTPARKPAQTASSKGSAKKPQLSLF